MFHPFVDQSGKDAINYFLNSFIGMFVCILFSLLYYKFYTIGIDNHDDVPENYYTWYVLTSLIPFELASISYFASSIIAAAFSLRGYSFRNRLVYPFIRS
jgi:uncharacterized Tic20 family protein